VTVSLRYALYYAPAPRSAWARFGEDWLARTDARLDHPRRYGFHATLKAPFRLKPETSLAQLIDELERFMRTQPALSVARMRIARLHDFLALVPLAHEPRLDALAAQCVKRFDRFRAPLSAVELDRRRREPLTQRQEALLARWGYPHVLDEFRFHLSLTGPLRGAEPPPVPPLPEAPLAIDAVTVFEDPGPPARLRAVHRACCGRRGRLVLVVGASGSGKDALIGWARERAHAQVKFARRTITRAEQPGGEPHHAVSESEFDAMLARGAFALHWRANGNRYGIGREVDAWLEEGRTVVVNGSREDLPRAAALYPQLEVVHVTAPEELLRARLQARAREDVEAITARLARRPPVPSAALEIDNGAELTAAGARLLRFLDIGGEGQDTAAGDLRGDQRRDIREANA
jgi:phosphonate metabolism protein PhnN/1,5-bisphosphokinase (PRPP-forming)